LLLWLVGVLGLGGGSGSVSEARSLVGCSGSGLPLVCCASGRFAMAGKASKAQAATRGKRASLPQTIEKVATTWQAGAQEVALQELTGLLRQRPEQILPCLAAVKDEFFMPKQAAHEQEFWPSSYVRFDQVPKYWLLGWLVSAVDFFDEPTLQKVDKASKTAIRELVEFATGVRAHGKLPRPCLNKLLLSRFFLRRMKAVGVRMTAEWWKRVLDPATMTLQWQKADCGVLSFVQPGEGEQWVKQVRHVSGVVAQIPEEVNVKAEWSLVKAWSDAGAGTSRGILDVKYTEKCGEFAAIRESLQYASLNKLALRLQADLGVDEKEAAEGLVKVAPDVLPSKKKLRKGPPATEEDHSRSVAAGALCAT